MIKSRKFQPSRVADVVEAGDEVLCRGEWVVVVAVFGGRVVFVRADGSQGSQVIA